MPKARKFTKRLRDRLLWLIMQGLARLPLRVNHWLGGALGWLAWALPTQGVRLARINLELCFPDAPAAWRERIARRSLMEMGKAATEASWLWRAGPDQLLALATLPEVASPGGPRTPGQALFLATPHLGAWEFFGLHAASFGRLTSLYSPFPVPEIDQWVRISRSATGAVLAPANREGLRLLKQARDRGEAIGILPDQSPSRATGVHAPFFGRSALTMTLLPRLLRDREDIVVFAFAERLPKGQGYRYHALQAGPEIRDADPVRAATAMNQLVEELIRRCPEQYNWAYKRFSPPGSGDTDPYP